MCSYSGNVVLDFTFMECDVMRNIRAWLLVVVNWFSIAKAWLARTWKYASIPFLLFFAGICGVALIDGFMNDGELFFNDTFEYLFTEGGDVPVVARADDSGNTASVTATGDQQEDYNEVLVSRISELTVKVDSMVAAVTKLEEEKAAEDKEVAALKKSIGASVGSSRVELVAITKERDSLVRDVFELQGQKMALESRTQMLREVVAQKDASYARMETTYKEMIADNGTANLELLRELHQLRTDMIAMTTQIEAYGLSGPSSNKMYAFIGKSLSVESFLKVGPDANGNYEISLLTTEKAITGENIMLVHNGVPGSVVMRIANVHYATPSYVSDYDEGRERRIINGEEFRVFRARSGDVSFNVSFN